MLSGLHLRCQYVALAANGSCVTTKGGAWDVQQGPEERLHFDAVVVAVGNYAEPNIPTDVGGMGACPLHQLHCHNFRSPVPFRGQTVLVVGGSFSGAAPRRMFRPWHCGLERAGLHALPWDCCVCQTSC